MTTHSRELRDHLLELLQGGHAHVGFDRTIAGWPPALRAVKPDGLTHTAWQILEHLRIAQWDIVEFSRSAEHVSPDWPAGYWPATHAPPTDSAWDESVAAFGRALEDMVQLVADTQNDLFAPFPWGTGQTLLREAMLLADHNAYHVGQLVDMRRILGTWPPTASAV